MASPPVLNVPQSGSYLELHLQELIQSASNTCPTRISVGVQTFRYRGQVGLQPLFQLNGLFDIIFIHPGPGNLTHVVWSYHCQSP